VFVLTLSGRDDEGLAGEYDQIGDLPEWMQDRLAVLRIMDTPPPVCDIPGVGKRMGDYLYYVYSD